MTIREMTSRELRSINPSPNDQMDAVEYLIELGWKFQGDSRAENPYSRGWWTHKDHSTKNRPVGDPKTFHQGAWDTVKLYVAKD